MRSVATGAVLGGNTGGHVTGGSKEETGGDEIGSFMSLGATEIVGITGVGAGLHGAGVRIALEQGVRVGVSTLVLQPRAGRT